MVGERGSKEARAAARPAILPVSGLTVGSGVRRAVEGEGCWPTRADQDFGGGRGGGGEVGLGDAAGVIVLGVSTAFGTIGLGECGTEFVDHV